MKLGELKLKAHITSSNNRIEECRHIPTPTTSTCTINMAKKSTRGHDTILATLPGLDVVVSSCELLIIPSLYSRNLLSSAGISMIVKDPVF